MLVRHHFLSLDPYMRGRMNDAKSYAAAAAAGPGDAGRHGGRGGGKHARPSTGRRQGGRHAAAGRNTAWSTPTQPGALRKVDTTHVPLSHYLGAVGMPGVTAWYGLVKIIEPKAGETVVVSAASGAVGSAFGALAKARGCRAVGIAGGPDKCKYVDGRTRLRRLHRLQAAPGRCKSLSQGAEGSLPERHRRLLRERRRHGASTPCCCA